MGANDTMAGAAKSEGHCFCSSAANAAGACIFKCRVRTFAAVIFYPRINHPGMSPRTKSRSSERHAPLFPEQPEREEGCVSGPHRVDVSSRLVHDSARSWAEPAISLPIPFAIGHHDIEFLRWMAMHRVLDARFNQADPEPDIVPHLEPFRADDDRVRVAIMEGGACFCAVLAPPPCKLGGDALEGVGDHARVAARCRSELQRWLQMIAGLRSEERRV